MPSLLSCRDGWRQKAERCEATLAAATQQVAALQAGVATEDACAAPREDDDPPRDAQDALLEQLGRAQGQVTCRGCLRQCAEPRCCSIWLASAVVVVPQHGGEGRMHCSSAGGVFRCHSDTSAQGS